MIFVVLAVIVTVVGCVLVEVLPLHYPIDIAGMVIMGWMVGGAVTIYCLWWWRERRRGQN